ncbi:MAG: glycosyltransferase [Trueperaceae bacterium]
MRTKPAKDFATTFASGFADDEFARRAERIVAPAVLDRLPRAAFSPWAEFTLLFRVLAAAARHRTLLLFSSRGYLKPELLAAALFGLLPVGWRPTVVFYGEMYEPSGGVRGTFERLAMRMAKRGIARFVLFSNDEHGPFQEAWGVNGERVTTCHCFLPEEPSTKAPDELPVSEGPYVFSGGSSFREFEPVIDAARLLPSVRFVIAAAPSSLPPDLPPNVSLGSLERDHYRPLLENAAVVVVPLRTDLRRAAGMFTYLRAMQLGKPVIVSDAIAVREYVDDGHTGMVVAPTGEGYATAIARALDPANVLAMTAMGEDAAQDVERRFTIRPYAARMLGIIDDARREASKRVAASPEVEPS